MHFQINCNIPVHIILLDDAVKMEVEYCRRFLKHRRSNVANAHIGTYTLGTDFTILSFILANRSVYIFVRIRPTTEHLYRFMIICKIY